MAEVSPQQRRARRGNWVFQLSRRVRHALDRSGISEQSVLMGLALVVGLSAGAGAAFFRWLIRQCQWLFFDQGSQWLGFLGKYGLIAIPALGGLIVGLLVYFLAREAKGHGVPEVMEAVALRGGIIRPRVAVIKSLASSICIGSGGSVGREGPIVQIGSSLGSTVGQLFRLSDARIRNLVACGAAGGIAATFNAPLAGAFFALEVLFGEFTVESFGAVVVAAVGASAVGWSVWGNTPAFQVPKYALASTAELPFFALLGVLGCLVGVAFTRCLYWLEDLFDRVPLKEYVKPALGGVLVGVAGLYGYREGVFPPVWGVGYETIGSVLNGELLGTVVLALLGLKLLATSLTLGSGGSGGVFAPSLFLGAMLGGAFGVAVQTLIPGTTTNPAAYALVGMGAVFAAASHAPITSIVIVFELTRDYRMILPLMFACGLATVLSRLLSRTSIYTEKLHRRGLHLSLGRDINLLNTVTVGEAMTTDLLTVRPEAKVTEVLDLLQETKHHGFPVADEQGCLHGVITLQDVRRAISEGHRDAPASEVATHRLLVCFPHETLNDALRKLGLRDVGRIPVVDPADHQRLLGLITRKNIIEAYNKALLSAHADLPATIETETFE